MIDSITIKTIPHDKQRYPTTGDWWVESDNVTGKKSLQIRVSESGDWRANIAVGIHEAVEAVVCLADGVDPLSLDEFDTAYEAVREDAKTFVDAEQFLRSRFGGHCEITDTSEPGDDLYAPYRHQHAVATQVEHIVTEAMHLPWKLYEDELAALDEDE